MGESDSVIEKKGLSVIVPVYNSEHYIEKCVDSLLNQSYDAIEIILVDDGSKDNSWQIMQHLATKDERIRILHQSNGGVNSARNAALRLASKPYIMFVDSDDGLKADTIKQNMEILEQDNMIDFLQFPISEVSETTGQILKLVEQEFEAIEGADNIFLNWYKRGAKLEGYLCAKIFKRELLDGLVLPEDMVITEDAFNISWFSRHSKKCVLSSIGAYYYLQRDGSASKSEYTAKKNYDFLRTRLQHYRYLIGITSVNCKQEQIEYFVDVLKDYISLKLKNSPDYEAKEEYRELKRLCPSASQICSNYKILKSRKLWLSLIAIMGLDKFIWIYTNIVKLRLKFNGK